jgi:peroxiredoxin
MALGVIVLASGCGTPGTAPQAGGASPTPIVAASSQPTPAASGAPTAVAETLKFTASTVDGQAFNAATLAGKPVVFWFWAAWCPKCKGDAANVRNLQQQLSGKAHIVGVAGLGSGTDAMRKFVADYQLGGFPQLADDAGVVWKRFEVPSQHYYIVLDSSGTMVHRGPLSTDQLGQKLAGLS